MPTWREKKAKAAEVALERDLQSGGNFNDVEGSIAKDVRGAAMGGKCLVAKIIIYLIRK